VPSSKLEVYFDALINDWDGFTSNPRKPVVWSVDFGRDDITWLMARAVAGDLMKRFDTDADLTGREWIKDQQATREALGDVLGRVSPALVVTTSHGMTAPLGEKAALIAQLGMPVDVERNVLRLSDLGGWKPAGAIWYAHACCSAGSDSKSQYATLLTEETEVGRIINGVASEAGAMVAPLPTALLETDAPLRAFVGHVEPTFDWTLRNPANNQVLTYVLCTSLYDRLFRQHPRTPIGYALHDVFVEAGQFFGAWQVAKAGIDQNVPGMRDMALYNQLVAMDRQTLVIIGDPTVSLPPL
jgi:hypothetical protein